jgi:hypothetical protein
MSCADFVLPKNLDRDTSDWPDVMSPFVVVDAFLFVGVSVLDSL